VGLMGGSEKRAGRMWFYGGKARSTSGDVIYHDPVERRERDTENINRRLGGYQVGNRVKGRVKVI